MTGRTGSITVTPAAPFPLAAGGGSATSGTGGSVTGGNEGGGVGCRVGGELKRGVRSPDTSLPFERVQAATT